MSLWKKIKTYYGEDYVLNSKELKDRLKFLLKQKDAEIIKGTIEGTSVCYCLNSSVFDTMSNTLHEFKTLDEKNTKECC